MNIFRGIHTLKMDQTNQSGSGSNGGGAGNQAQGSPQFTPPEKGGSGTQQSGAAAGQQSSKTSEDPYSNGGGGTEDLGAYGADGNLKQKPPAKHEAIDLKYKIDGLEDLSDDEITQIKEFAKNNRFSKEQAQAYLSNYKGMIDKAHQNTKEQEKIAADKVLVFKQAEVKKLVAAIGGKDGADFKQNYTKLGQFLEKHMPEFKKALDGSAFFPPSSVMKELFDFQEKLTKEDSLVNGGAAGGKESVGGGLFGFFGGNKN